MAVQKHSVEVIKPSLEIDEDLPLHEKGWKVQKAGWALIFLFVAAGIAGLFGEGPLSQQKQKAGAVTAEYEKFFRYETEMKIFLHSEEHVQTLALPQDYVKRFRMLHFEPEPISNNTVNGEIVYNFLNGDNRQLTIYLVTKDYGKVAGRITVNQKHQISLTHFIYP